MVLLQIKRFSAVAIVIRQTFEDTSTLTSEVALGPRQHQFNAGSASR